MKRGRVGAVLILFGLLLLAGCVKKSEHAQVQETEANAAEGATIPSSELPEEVHVILLEGAADFAQAYADTINQWEKEAEGLTYDLIYLDEDEIPELVVGHTGYWVSVYTYSGGTLYTVMDDWGYGAMGNHGYEYVPKKNVVRNYNGDLAGAIMKEFYGKINENHELESYYEEGLSMWMFKDTNHNYQMDEDEWHEGEMYYYYGEDELTEDEYEAFQISGAYQYLEGTKTVSEMRAQLQGFRTDTDTK